jgi:hypothetical protein
LRRYQSAQAEKNLPLTVPLWQKWL